MTSTYPSANTTSFKLWFGIVALATSSTLVEELATLVLRPVVFALMTFDIFCIDLINLTMIGGSRALFAELGPIDLQ